MTVMRSSDNLIVRCTNFPADIFVWALAHFEGNLELSIAGQIVYQKKLGVVQRALLFVVNEDCSCNMQPRSVLGEDNVNTITVSASMESGLRILSKTDTEWSSICGKRPSTRAALYNLDGYTGCSFGKLLPEEKRRILQSSQNVVLWVLGRPASLCSIGRSNQSIVSKSSDLLIGDLLSRWPRICNERFGGACIPATVSPGPRQGLLPPDILSQFQETREVLDVCSSRCSCQGCSHHEDSYVHRSGCLKTMANSEILRTIAHAIADGFGADDTSGFIQAGTIEGPTFVLLFYLLESPLVPWEQWFGLVASVFLGCYTIDSRARFTSAELVAVQYGSTVIAAPWIDLSSEVQAKASFGFESAQARLCDADEDRVFVCTEHTARSSFGNLDLCEAKLPRHGYEDNDTTELSLLAAIEPSRDNPFPHRIDAFTLLTIAKVGKYTRIIDPADIFYGLASSGTSQCTHINSTRPAVSLSSPHRIWSFEEAVGFWEANNFEDKSSSWTYYTTILDSHAKLNTLLALSPQGCIVKTADCCFACAQKRLDGRFPDSKGRRILSIAVDEKSIIRR